MRALTPKTAIVALGLFGAAAFASTAASAMPNGLPQADHISNAEQIHWVCGPYRCWWRPNVYGAYGFYGGPRFHGWHRGWHHGWGHHRW